MSSQIVDSIGRPSAMASDTALRFNEWRRFLPSLRVAMLVTALLAFGCGLAKGILWGVPPPVAQDESGYLLSADTFASGRITNPTHPMWRHFESMFVIQKPTYTGKYPPGQSLFLALGQKLSGEPIVGVWISTALASAAICWMLWQWLTPPWAMVGSLIAVAHLVVNYWNYTYWGGSVAALGGALVFGAIRRFPERFRVIDGVLIGLGVALFANTRPFEGLVTCAAAAVLLVVMIMKERIRISSDVLVRLLIPLVMVVALAAVWLGFYNWRTTGNALRFAQDVHSKAYYPVPYLILQHAGPAPAYDHDYMKVQYLRDIHEFREQQSIRGFLDAAWTKFMAMWGFYVGVGLTIPLLWLPFLFKNAWMRFAVLVSGFAVAVMLLETWLFPHYAAPIAPLLFLILTECVIVTSSWRLGDFPVGRILAGLVVLFHLALLGLTVAHRPTYIEKNEPWALARQRLLQRFGSDSHKHLMIVRYAADHRPDYEWVYNKADLDNTPVVWAHEMSPADQHEILNYYSNRYVWLVEADLKPPRVSLLRGPTPSVTN